MMGRQIQQQKLIFVSLEDLVPVNHLLKKIHRFVFFDFIYDIFSPYYLVNGRSPIDSVCMLYHSKNIPCYVGGGKIFRYKQELLC